MVDCGAGVQESAGNGWMRFASLLSRDGVSGVV
jgi:hypothetical protein